MSWIDIAIIILVVLFALLGVWRGGQRAIMYTCVFLVTFVIAFFLSNVIAEALLGIDGVRLFVFGSDPHGQSGWSLYSWILNSNLGTPSDFIASTFRQPILDKILTFPGYIEGTFIADPQGYSLVLAFNLFSLMVGVGLFIVVRLLFCLVTMVIKSYIPRKRTAGSRVGGLFVGMLRGLLWAFVITVAFSNVGGLSYASAINAIENEYETAVVGNYINVGAYWVKNNLAIPGEEMYQRLVARSGFAVKDGDRPQTPEEVDDLKVEKYHIFVDLMNLNYDGTPYSVVGGVITSTDDATRIDTTPFTDTGFAEAYEAILSYNEAAAASINVNNTLQGSLATANPDQLASYSTTISNIYDLLCRPDDDHEKFETYFVSYQREITTARTYTESTDQLLVQATDATMARYRNKIVTTLDAVKQEYVKLGLIAADPSVGDFTLPAYPEALTVEKIQQNTVCGRIASKLDALYKADGERIDASVYSETGMEDAINALIDYNDKVVASINADFPASGSLGAADSDELSAYLVICDKISDIVSVPSAEYGSNTLKAHLDDYLAEIEEIKQFTDETDDAEKAAADAKLDEYYGYIVKMVTDIKKEYDKLELITEDRNVGTLTVPNVEKLTVDKILGDDQTQEENGSEENTEVPAD